MPDLFQQALASLRPIEAGYSNNPNDSGGETNYGITVAVARAYGYQGSMKDMPRSVAEDIYRKKYWDYQMLDAVAAVSPAIAVDLFKAGVNLGPDVVGKFLQRSLNVLNMHGTFYKDISTDGRIGPMTVAALNEYVKRRQELGVVVLRRALNSLLGAFYITLTEQREKDEDFVFGWLAKRVD